MHNYIAHNYISVLWAIKQLEQKQAIDDSRAVVEYLQDLTQWNRQGLNYRLTEAGRLHVLNLITERLLSLASRRSELRPVLDDLAACLKERLFHSFHHEALPLYQEVRALMSLDGAELC